MFAVATALTLAFAPRDGAFAPRDLNGTLVFYDGLAGVANYRIPAVVLATTEPPSIVAFAEARHGGDSSASRIAVRSSTDGGATWSDVVFAAGSVDTPAARAACAANRTSCRVGNPAATFDDKVTESSAILPRVAAFPPPLHHRLLPLLTRATSASHRCRVARSCSRSSSVALEAARMRSATASS